MHKELPGMSLLEEDFIAKPKYFAPSDAKGWLSLFGVLFVCLFV